MRPKRPRKPRPSELFERSGAKVTWNEHVPDPDNPKKPRQIAITIRRGDHVTHVECRIWSRKRSVTWIEGLMGRRESLGAHAVIAVSAGGFTKSALVKAAAHNVGVRDLRSLSDDEV